MKTRSGLSTETDDGPTVYTSVLPLQRSRHTYTFEKRTRTILKLKMNVKMKAGLFTATCQADRLSGFVSAGYVVSGHFHLPLVKIFYIMRCFIWFQFNTSLQMRLSGLLTDGYLDFRFE